MWLNIYSSAVTVYGAAMECQTLSGTITVGTSGHEQFKSIQAAIDSIPANNNKWIKITISPGVYK